MISKTTEKFRQSFKDLPVFIKQLAKKKYNLWKLDPFHNSLKFKRISKSHEIYSIRIGQGWRALGVKQKEQMIWFWIGSHEDYNKLVKSYQ